MATLKEIQESNLSAELIAQLVEEHEVAMGKYDTKAEAKGLGEFYDYLLDKRDTPAHPKWYRSELLTNPAVLWDEMDEKISDCMLADGNHYEFLERIENKVHLFLDEDLTEPVMAYLKKRGKITTLDAFILTMNDIWQGPLLSNRDGDGLSCFGKAVTPELFAKMWEEKPTKYLYRLGSLLQTPLYCNERARMEAELEEKEWLQAVFDAILMDKRPLDAVQLIKDKEPETLVKYLGNPWYDYKEEIGAALLEEVAENGFYSAEDILKWYKRLGDQILPYIGRFREVHNMPILGRSLENTEEVLKERGELFYIGAFTLEMGLHNSLTYEDFAERTGKYLQKYPQSFENPFLWESIADMKNEEHRRELLKFLAQQEWISEAAAKAGALSDKSAEGVALLSEALNNPVESEEVEQTQKEQFEVPQGSAWLSSLKEEYGVKIEDEEASDALMEYCAKVMTGKSALAHPDWAQVANYITSLSLTYGDITEYCYGERLSLDQMEDDEGGSLDTYYEEGRYTYDAVLTMLADEDTGAHPEWFSVLKYCCTHKSEAISYMSVADEEAVELVRKKWVKKRPDFESVFECLKEAFPYDVC